jgi:hypothetical protein
MARFRGLGSGSVNRASALLADWRTTTLVGSHVSEQPRSSRVYTGIVSCHGERVAHGLSLRR